MRTILFFFCLISIATIAQEPAYKLTIKLRGDVNKVYLETRKESGLVRVDSTEIINGVGFMTGKIVSPDAYGLGFKNKNNKMMFFLENAEITISGHVDSLKNAVVTGSSIHDQYKTFQARMDQKQAEGMNLYGQYQELKKAGKNEEAEALMAKLDIIQNEMNTQQRDFIKENPTSAIAPFLLSRIFYGMEADELEGYLKGFDASLANNTTVVTMKKRVEKLKAVAIGKTALDFTLNDPEGNPIKLSDIYKKNKYTLIDFWASWCGPCRKENPNVVAVFNQYKDKGFGIFGVSLDQSKEKWLEAIAKDQLTWPHVSDLKGWANAAAGMYAVNSIPANLLVDSEGEIIAKNLREEKLKEKIAELLNQ